MKTRIAISIVCVLLAVGHNIWPSVKVDMTTLALVVVALLPWLSSVLKSVELPGGIKIELQDVVAATEKVAANVIAGTPQPARQTAGTLDYLRNAATTDPNLALVAMRIEIEQRLVVLTEQAGLPRRSAGLMLRDLVARGKIDADRAAGLQEFISLGNKAAHGAEVSRGAAEGALDAIPRILDLLDTLIAMDRNKTAPAAQGGIA